MNKIEQSVYKLVKNNYIIKNTLRNIYQGFFDLLPNYPSSFVKTPIIHENFFFGFHDLNPFSMDNKKVLSNHLTIPLRMPNKNDVLEVGYWDGPNFSQWHKVGNTYAWNYHKGCRLQWNDDNHCIYNIAEKGILKSEIVNIQNKEHQIIDWPVDTVSNNGRLATNFSYWRLEQMMPGYGYVFSDKDAYLDEPISNRTGLYLIDLETNKRRMLLSLKDISEIHHSADMDNTFHFVTHTEFSYDNRYIAFLHRWYKGTYRRTRLIVYDLQSKEIYVSPTNGMVSHYAWNKENGIVAYCRIEDTDSHVYFDTPQMSSWKRCGYPRLNSDGHQHFMDNDWFLVDTYPDKWRHCKLYKVNRKTDEVVLLADVKSPKRFVSPNEHKHWKCDLHPRCNNNGTLICFDSVHTGKRALCIIEQ